jgi:hypothetical protein
MPDELLTASDQPSPTPTPTAASSLPLSKKRLGVALAIAAIADVLGAFVTTAPPIVWAVDLVTAILLFMVLGWRWMLLPGIILEAIPGVSVMPFWVLVVGAIAVWGTPRPKLQQ